MLQNSPAWIPYKVHCAMTNLNASFNSYAKHILNYVNLNASVNKYDNLEVHYKSYDNLIKRLKPRKDLEVLSRKD